MIVLARGLALPEIGPSSHMTNCSLATDGTCSLTVSAPAANEWQYLKFVVLGRTKVNFTLYIETKGKPFIIIILNFYVWAFPTHKNSK